MNEIKIVDDNKKVFFTPFSLNVFITLFSIHQKQNKTYLFIFSRFTLIYLGLKSQAFSAMPNFAYKIPSNSFKTKNSKPEKKPV